MEITFYSSYRVIFSLENVFQRDATLPESGILSNWLCCLLQNNLWYLGLLVLYFHFLGSSGTNIKADKGDIYQTAATAVLQHLDAGGNVQAEEFNFVKAAVSITNQLKRERALSPQFQTVFTMMQPPPSPNFQRESPANFHPCCDSLPSQH